MSIPPSVFHPTVSATSATACPALPDLFKSSSVNRTASTCVRQIWGPLWVLLHFTVNVLPSALDSGASSESIADVAASKSERMRPCASCHRPYPSPMASRASASRLSPACPSTLIAAIPSHVSGERRERAGDPYGSV